MSIQQAVQRAELRAGGTDLSERRRSGISRGEIVDIQPSDDLTRIAWSGEAARIGALVTIATVAADARLRKAYPGLAAAAVGLATPQIRAVGTLGGNLAQRSRCWYYRNPHLACLKKGGADCPARAGNHLYGVIFDLGPCVAPHPSTLGAALLAYGATVTTDRRGPIPVAEIFGDGTSATSDNTLAERERILHIDMPPAVAGERAAYRRAISRAYAEWPLVEVVVRAVVEQQRFTLVRVAAGGVAPVPLRLREVEQALAGAPADSAAIRAAAASAIAKANPLPGAAYKTALLRQLVADLLEQAAH
jgi:xanthine dehydrogenase YagS FAD-binding subunit